MVCVLAGLGLHVDHDEPAILRYIISPRAVKAYTMMQLKGPCAHV